MNAADETMAVEHFGKSWTYKLVPGDYPPWQSLWPNKDHGTTGAPSIGLNPILLARFAKVVSDRGKVTGTDANKGSSFPVTFTWSDNPLKAATWAMGGDVVGLIMPIKINR